MKKTQKNLRPVRSTDLAKISGGGGMMSILNTSIRPETLGTM